MIPNKNGVWIAAKLKNNGHWNFSCPIEKVAWKHYRYSTEQRSNGAFEGGLFDTRSNEVIIETACPLDELLKENRLIVKRFHLGPLQITYK